MRFRSAITGRFVRKLFAMTNRATTVSESTTAPDHEDDGEGLDERPGTVQCQYCGRYTRQLDVCEWCGSELYEGED